MRSLGIAAQKQNNNEHIALKMDTQLIKQVLQLTCLQKKASLLETSAAENETKIEAALKY